MFLKATESGYFLYGCFSVAYGLLIVVGVVGRMKEQIEGYNQENLLWNGLNVIGKECKNLLDLYNGGYV